MVVNYGVRTNAFGIWFVVVSARLCRRRAPEKIVVSFTVALP